MALQSGGFEITGGGLVERNASGGKGLELAVQIHLTGKILEDGHSLDMEVAEHCVALPASKETDEVTVNTGGNKGHCAGGTEGFDGDISRIMAEREEGRPIVGGED
jgi:hypothetical protein